MDLNVGQIQHGGMANVIQLVLMALSQENMFG
jgi:hypothetical protein